MTNGLKIAAGVTVVLAMAVGGEALYLRHRNAEDARPASTGPQGVNYLDRDDATLVGLKHEHPMSLKDERDLKGRTLWMSAGGQMDYYPYIGRVDYAHSKGTLLGSEKILVHDAVEQVAPKKAAFRIPQGDRHVLLVFSKPDDKTNDKTLYAVPVGTKQDGSYSILTDDIFFYDDPHKTFDYWGPEVWKAIDEHRATLGMSEAEVQMALGQVSMPHGDRIGERSVDFDNQGKAKRVTFEGGKATKIEDEAIFGR
jgi:hypothetical protein